MSEATAHVRLHAIVHGRPGVSFRYYASIARGNWRWSYVRNRPDGSAEVVAEGTQPTSTMLAFLRPPRSAFVTEVETS